MLKANIPTADMPVAQFALVFFSNANQFAGVVRCPINNGVLGSGDYVELEDVLNTISPNLNRSPTIIDSGVLVNSQKYLIWHKPSIVRPMWFKQHGQRQLMLNVKWPSLLFIANRKDKNLSVMAVGTNTRPHNRTALYHVPLMNIGNDGKVCQGSATLPDVIDIDTISDIEATIYDSNFTHVNHSQTLSIGDGSNSAHFNYWSGKNESGERVFAKEMVRFSQPTFGQLISSLT